MKLPHGDQAVISREKLLGYILSESHATGKFKAKFFRKLGFNKENVAVFEKTLRDIAKSSEISNELSSPFGIKYTIDSEINTPTGKLAKITTVWIVEKDQIRPRFITVYPV